MSQEIAKLRLERRKLILELKKLAEEAPESKESPKSIQVASLQEIIMITNEIIPIRSLHRIYRDWFKDAGKDHYAISSGNLFGPLETFPFITAFVGVPAATIFVLIMFVEPSFASLPRAVIIAFWIAISLPLSIQSARRELLRSQVHLCRSELDKTEQNGEGGSRTGNPSTSLGLSYR
jgi:hypothetical protein